MGEKRGGGVGEGRERSGERKGEEIQKSEPTSDMLDQSLWHGT